MKHKLDRLSTQPKDHTFFYEGYMGTDSFDTSVRAIQLAEQLGLKVEQRTGGAYWCAFTKDGKQITNVSFYQPSHAYAFLLGYEAALKVNHA